MNRDEEARRVAAGAGIRVLGHEHSAARAFVTGYAFASGRDDRAAMGFATLYPISWTRGIFHDGHLIASLLLLPYTLSFEGRRVPMGGISDVACLPEHRRQGFTGRLLRGTLAELYEQGTPLSGLYTPHAPLYRRFGWEIATRWLRLRVPVKQARLREGATPSGHAVRVAIQAWPRLNRIYEAWIAGRNGELNRWEARWRENVFGGDRQPRDVAVWVDGEGRDRGYAAYRESGWRDDRRGNLDVREVVALDGDAYRGLTAYLLNHDLSQDALWPAAEDEPLLDVLDDPNLVAGEIQSGLLLRIVDLPKAFAARPCYVETPASVAIAVRDRTCPWNDGTWRISGEAGELTAEPVTADPALLLDVRTLAALYNGFTTPEAAAAAGLIEVHDPAALATAHALLATHYRPSCKEGF